MSYRSTLAVACAFLSACADGSSPTTEATGLEVRVAPLTLPGLSNACYDVEVRNGAGELVWSRGDFNTSAPDDATTLCARQFGNGAGGDISYVGPCDADLPEHKVSLVVDSLFDTDGDPLDDWQNPCPAGDPCVLTVACEENADTPITFNLTIMRAANQGFFDIAVNFDAIFCSAKVDCTYDAEGLEPIELLFDPVTGERTQTAVVALACSAGPGEDVDTALFMNDIRVMCGDVESTLFANYILMSCDDPGDAFYGMVQTVTTNNVVFQGAAWLRDVATGAYEATPVTVNGMPPVPVTDPDAAWQGMPFQMLDTNTAMMVLGLFGDSTDPQDPITAIRELRPAIATRSGLTTFDVDFTFKLVSDVDPTVRPVALPSLSVPSEFVIARDALDGGSDGPPDLGLVAYQAQGSGDPYFPDPYGPPIRLNRPNPASAYARCDAEVVYMDRALVAWCMTVGGAYEVAIWDLTQPPGEVIADQLYELDAAVLTIAPGDFTYSGFGTDDGQPAVVDALKELDIAGFIRGTGGAPDAVFLTSNHTFSNYPWERWTAIYAARQSPTAFVLAVAPYGQRPLPTEPAPSPLPSAEDGSSFRAVVQPLDASSPVVIGDLALPGGYWEFVARHDRAGGAHTIVDAFWEGAVNGFRLAPYLRGGLYHPTGDFFALGSAQYQDGVRRPFIARATQADGVALTLPVPDGWNLEDVAGIRGASAPVPGAIRLLSGVVYDPSNANQRYAIVWRVNTTDSGFELVDWYVHGTVESVDNFTADWDDFRRDIRYEYEASPIYDAAIDRCPQTVDSYRNNNNVFDDTAIIVDPALENAALPTVTIAAPISAAGFTDGTLVVREPVEAPLDFLPTVSPDAMALLDPAQTLEGNVWNSTNPKPAEMPDFVLQMASYHGDESLDCDGEPCNKRFWTTAIAFDPTVPNCRLAFEATAARVSSLVNGFVPPGSLWPAIIGRVQLTSAPLDGEDVEMVCTQNPLGSDALSTRYLELGDGQAACYSYGANGAPPAMSGGGECPLTADNYLQLDLQLE